MVASISCQKNQAVKSTTTPPDHKTLAITDPANSNNPHDAAGYWHNEGLDYVKANTDEYSTDEDVADAVRYFWANYPSSPWSHADDEDAEDMTDAVINVGGDCSISANDFDDIEAYNYYADLVADIQNEDFDEEEYDDFWTLIVAWEDDVLNDVSLSTSDKEMLLGCASILRYSGFYWANEDIGNNWARQGGGPKRKWWEIGLADLGGGIFGGGLFGFPGFVGGALIASAIVAYA